MGDQEYAEVRLPIHVDVHEGLQETAKLAVIPSHHHPYRWQEALLFLLLPNESLESLHGWIGL